ncbi:MAG TPA: hypothetical protein DDW49_10450 [Deltaproteobacteria bacterium]|nr:MAG: hypothetical protein A2048_05915 [Deltaproteobacteria bacterium GWA2_45_12]HBF13782.1 hypothetical protein [Deltaproteobacteria bacterium]
MKPDSCIRDAKRVPVEKKLHFIFGIYEDVARSYYTVLTFQDQINTTEKVTKVSHQRLGELKKRVGLGKTRQASLIWTKISMLQYRQC